MARSETAVARDWILGLEPGTWFWNTDVPASTNVARTVLHRLKNDPNHGIEKVAHGLYWRGWPEGDTYHCLPPSKRIGALIYAGPGAGLYGWSALNNLEWTLQCPAKIFVVSTRKQPPRPICSTVVYSTNSNWRRTELTWAEVTVLEAIHMFEYTEEPWHECLDHLVIGISAKKLGWGGPNILIRPQMLIWAAETERRMTVESLHRLNDIARASEHVSQKAAL